MADVQIPSVMLVWFMRIHAQKNAMVKYRYRMKSGPHPIKIYQMYLPSDLPFNPKIKQTPSTKATGSGRIRSYLLSGFDSQGEAHGSPVWLKKWARTARTWHTGLGISVPLDIHFRGLIWAYHGVGWSSKSPEPQWGVQKWGRLTNWDCHLRMFLKWGS